MIGARTARPLLAGAVLAVAMVAVAEGKLGYFEDDTLSFEGKGEAKGPAPRTQEGEAGPEGSPAPRRRPPPPPAAVAPPPPTVRPAPTHPGPLPSPPPPGITLGAAPPPVSPSEPLPSRTVGGVVTKPDRSGSTSLGAALGYQILRVRQLNADEREGTKGKLRCKDPLVAEIRTERATRLLLAGIMNVPEENVPETLNWVFSRRGTCFDRSSRPEAKALDALDEAARRAAPRAGGL